MWNRWEFRVQVLPEFGYPVPTLSYQNQSDVNVAMLVFRPDTRTCFLVVRKAGYEDVKIKGAGTITGQVKLLPVFTPLPSNVPSPRQIFLEKEFSESEIAYALNLGVVEEDSNTIKFISLLQHADRFFLLDEADQTVFEIEANLKTREAHSFLGFCAK